MNLHELYFDFTSKLIKFKTSKKAELETGRYFASTIAQQKDYCKPRALQSAFYINI